MAPVKLVIDTYHGLDIEDPYRYMEDLKDTVVLNWLKQQGAYTSSELEKIPGKESLIALQEEVDHMLAAKITQLKITGNNKHFYLKRETDDNVSRLYYRKGFNKKEVLLFDPAEFDPDSKIEYIINYIQPDWDGNQIVVSLSKKGEEISQMVILDVSTGERKDLIIDHCWPAELGGISWLPDNSGFLYVHLPVIDPKSKDFLINTKSVLYKIGDDPKNLNVLFSSKFSPDFHAKAEDFPIVYIRNRNDKYMLGWFGGASSYSDTYYAPIPSGKNSFQPQWSLLYQADRQIKLPVIKGDSLIYRTSKNAPNFRICKTTLPNPDFDHPRILVPEKKMEVITDFEVTSKGIFYSTTKNGIEASLYKYNKGENIPIDLPEASGSLTITSKGTSYPDLWITTKGWTSNGNRYKYDISQNIFTKADLVKGVSLPGLKNLVVEELIVQSHDGEEVPLSLIYRKGIKKDGNNRVLYFGYGSYGFSMNPAIYNNLYPWVARGGIFAVPHVRGGGEKGETWHKGGFKTTKPNSWKDLIACTEYMIKEGYTAKERSVIWSGSAGGILVGRAMTERPDLFGAVIIQVGSMNMIRSETQPNGPNNVKEFGTVKDPEEFKALLEMDSYHHIKDGEHYPATIITAGMNDPRVVAWDPAKFAARLQAANASGNPILFDIDFESGHGVGDSKAKQFATIADLIAFALWQTGHKDYKYKEN
ncbi:prolyl oligopeptidase family serine peptidase [Sinomicrobium weinanense]|uniref:prolyl oligopeptidase n=1 Tax=Sinomicrobium weinanense TaxID=2842200 RepID=A0A926JPI1_9FLAO|nr:prolyl oligopeptidase family serine peptidase [Sinomicrobium weinanense]MBC9795095.1 prolyl oligopeptidase family serine peptidase [Sinomicrobium weinanense]MBU3123774.1 prolyl oligopeptidase family serine peptidase [Sinomicrobium weinanense]